AERCHQAAAINPTEGTARANLRSSVTKFLPLTGAAALLLLKGVVFKAPFAIAWVALGMSGILIRDDGRRAWPILLCGLLAVVLTILYLVLLFFGLRSLRVSRFKHVPQRLQTYFHLERSRSWHDFVYSAVGGASLCG